MLGDIVLTVDDNGPADASRFFTAGTHLLSLLDSLSEKAGVDWQVADLHMGCAVAALEAVNGFRDVGVAAAASAVQGLRVVRDGGKLPSDWSPDAVSRAKELVNTVKPDSKIEAHTDVVWLDEKLRVALEQQSPWTREFYGTVRGQLTGVNVTRGNRASVKPQVGGRVVQVGFDGALARDMKSGFLNFVEINGFVKQDDQGRNYYIRAEEIKIIEASETSWQDVRASIPDFTHGLSVEEYLESIRGEE